MKAIEKISPKFLGISVFYPLLALSFMASVLIAPEFSAAAQQAPTKTQSTTNPPTPASSKQEVAVVDPAIEASIRHMFEIADMKSAIKETLQKSSETMRDTLRTNLPPGEYREYLIDLFFARFQSKFTPETLIDLSVPVYAKYYSKEEIDRLAEFYATPLGKKSLSVTQKAVFEIQMASMKLGEQLGRDSMMEILAEHPDIAKALEAAAKPPEN